MLIFLIFILLFVISIQDIRTLSIQDRYLLLLLLVVFINGTPFEWNTLIFACLFTICFLCFYHFQMMGGADIKLFFIAQLFLGTNTFIFSLFLTSSFSLTYCLLTKKKKIPFIPFISIGILLTYVLKL